MAPAFPTIFLLDTHLTKEKYHQIEQQIPTLTKDIKKAKLVIGKVTTKQRAQFELRCRQVWTEDVAAGESNVEAIPVISTPPRKRQKVEREFSSDSDNDSHGSSGFTSQSPTVAKQSQSSVATSFASQEDENIIRVVKLAWFEDSLKADDLLPLDGKYLVFEGRKIPKPKASNTTVTGKRPRPEDILTRAKAEAFDSPAPSKYDRSITHHPKTRPTHLLHQTTSEHDDPSRYPPLPAHLKQPYSCCRPTPAKTQNDTFISLLKKIQRIRKLQGDIHYGVKSYGSAIASIAAYPYPLTSVGEFARLPACGEKLQILFQEYLNTGTLQEAERLESDEELRVVNEFFEIFGCGDITAMQFYKAGFRSLDDIIENRWSNLTRGQQIGLKYYDEFLLPIPRAEVESIGQIVLDTANEIYEEGGFQMLIVGGYRRGKELNGDVDIILSHPNEQATINFITPLIGLLMEKDFITAQMIISTHNSERGQRPVEMKSDIERSAKGHGFDTLDKANVAWQNPNWLNKEFDRKKAEVEGRKVKNPNPHRRVDIIISPWKTVGCAVAGWTSGTTFQRDLRKYCRKEKGWKFDSSGVRNRWDGSWVDLEGGGGGGGGERGGGERGEKEGMVEAEMRVFEGLGLEWLRPEERCTG